MQKNKQCKVLNIIYLNKKNRINLAITMLRQNPFDPKKVDINPRGFYF